MFYFIIKFYVQNPILPRYSPFSDYLLQKIYESKKKNLKTYLEIFLIYNKSEKYYKIIFINL